MGRIPIDDGTTRWRQFRWLRRRHVEQLQFKQQWFQQLQFE
jgi:hypothetical protein